MDSEDRICLASGDGHVGPPTAVYRDHLERWLQPLFDEYLADHVWRWSPQSPDSFFPPQYNAKLWDSEGFDPSVGTATVWDPELRLKAMDQAMVACDVLVPDDQNMNDPPWGAGLANATVEGPDGANPHPPGLVRAGARAYNRWLAEFCSASPERLRGITLLGTMDDVVWVVDEIHRAFESGLTTGVLLPLDYYLPPYHHPRYDIVWQACSELGLSFVTHVSRGHPNYIGTDPRTQFVMYGVEAFWYAQRPIWTMILGGVLERFPDLRLVITELGVGWVAPLLKGLDTTFGAFPGMKAEQGLDRRSLSMEPSEYWKRQCFVTHSTSQHREHFEGEAFDAVPNMVWGADIGHAEGWWPTFGFPPPVPDGLAGPEVGLPVLPAADMARSLWRDLPAAKLRPYLETNFFRAYPNVDRAALQEVVDRIGPTSGELGLT
jgi:predicted TIM-barrel fold metal-dependent hydrolase